MSWEEIGTDHLRSKPIDMVNHPPHYTSHPSGIECIEIARHLTGDWFNAFKYVFRADLKNGRQDIEKSIFYIKDSISHNISIFASTWSLTEMHKLKNVIAAEHGYRRAFFNAIRRNDRRMALEYAEIILTEFDNAR